jgi:serine/threonine protein kinase/tetratricopeptide (TPR) repeat protein
MIGQTLGHYHIIEKIGAGGMGEVYRAHDVELDRDVALKVLPVGILMDNRARRRFRNEALVLASLNHPNVATIHEFATQEGIDFLVMEHVMGSSLAQELKGGPLPEKQVVTLAAQIAQALQEAHEHGVVHNDLKPGNVMVNSKGRAKVLDFGLAGHLRSMSEKTTVDSLNEQRLVAGTLPYMAPEQLLGEATDTRTDIYSLGVLLFEMVTGQRPFREELATRLTDDILHQTPVSPRTVSNRMSPELEQIILKCLEKEPENRYQSVKDLEVDLRRLQTKGSAPMFRIAGTKKAPSWRRVAEAIAVALIAAVAIGLSVRFWREKFSTHVSPPQIHSLAVLPLSNLSADPQQEYFADGMTEELTTQLAQISALRVISRTSVMKYKGSQKSASEIASELNVDAVVEGSVMRWGDRVRITAQLIQASTDKHLWAKHYERDLKNVLSLQDDVARAIADEVKVKLTPQEQARLSTVRQVDPEAYQLYLHALYQWNEGTPGGGSASRRDFQRAIEKDPRFARAYVALAFADALTDDFAGAKEAAKKGLALDDTLGGAHAALGLASYRGDWDWPAAGRELRRAIELSPSDSLAHHTYAMYLSDLGQHEEAISEMRRALELDPLSPLASANLGVLYWIASENDKAVQQLKVTLEMNPNLAHARTYLAEAYVTQGRYEEAASEFQKAGSFYGDAFLKAHLAYLYAVQGRRDEARKLLPDLQAGVADGKLDSYEVAVVYAALGDKDHAMDWLEKAFQGRSPYMPDLKEDPHLQPLRSDRRFNLLLSRVGLSP